MISGSVRYKLGLFICVGSHFVHRRHQKQGQKHTNLLACEFEDPYLIPKIAEHIVHFSKPDGAQQGGYNIIHIEK